MLTAHEILSKTTAYEIWQWASAQPEELFTDPACSYGPITRYLRAHGGGPNCLCPANPDEIPDHLQAFFYALGSLDSDWAWDLQGAWEETCYA